MPGDDYVQLADDGTGKKVKNYLLLGVVQSDGTPADVYVQCVAIQDADGRRLDFDETNGLLRTLVQEVRWLRKGFGEMTDNAALTIGLSDGSGDGGDGT